MKTNYSVILCDDDADDQLFLAEAIRNARNNCTITSAFNGLELMDILYHITESHTALPDLIILDLNMPLMNGYEVLKKIKNTNILLHIPVYVLTTSEFEYDKIKSIAYGATAFYSKPYLNKELIRIVEEIFSKSNIPAYTTLQS